MIAWTLMLFLALGDEPQVQPAPAAAPAQDPDRPAISAAELKALRDNNIFSPRSAKRSSRPSYAGSRSTPPAPVKPKAPVVTGIFFDSRTQAHHAIVEDKNDAAHKLFKEPKFMKAGDEWSGLKLESVGADKAVFSRDGATKDVHVGESLPETESAPLSSLSSDEDAGEETAAPSTSESPSSRKGQFRGRSESRTEAKSSATPENQQRTLEEMKKRLKKNRPSDDE